MNMNIPDHLSGHSFIRRLGLILHTVIFKFNSKLIKIFLAKIFIEKLIEIKRKYP